MPVDMKHIIAETYQKMILHGNVDKITVKALIDECHISRQTFYYHFQDIMDVMEWSVRQETQKLVAQSLEMKDTQSVMRTFIAFTVEHFPMLQKLMNSQRRAQFEKLMVDSMETYLSELAPLHPHSFSLNEMDRKVLLQYNACGLVGVLLAYGGKADLDQDRLALQLEQILSAELTGWHDT